MTQPVYQPNTFVPGVDYSQYRQNPRTGEWVYGQGVKYPSQMSDQEYFQATGGLNRQGQSTLQGTAPSFPSEGMSHDDIIRAYTSGDASSLTGALSRITPTNVSQPYGGGLTQALQNLYSQRKTL